MISMLALQTIRSGKIFKHKSFSEKRHRTKSSTFGKNNYSTSFYVLEPNLDLMSLLQYATLISEYLRHFLTHGNKTKNKI